MGLERRVGNVVCTSTGGVLEEVDVYRRGGEVDVADDGAADKDILDGALWTHERVS